jgi:hypothetical protein
VAALQIEIAVAKPLWSRSAVQFTHVNARSAQKPRPYGRDHPR